MSVGKTAASIGIQFVADPKQAEKAIAELQKSIGGFGGSSQGWRKDLAADASVLGGAAADGLGRLGRGFRNGAADARKFALATGAIGVTAAAVGLVAMATSLGSTGAAAGRVADRLGMPVERLSQLQIAARLAGSSADDMTSSLVSLQSTVSDAAYGRNNDAWSAFHAAGIDIGNAKDGAKDYAAILPKIADETQKLARVDRNAALRFLDKVGVSRDLFPALRNGSAGLQDYMNQAAQFGPLTQKQADDARELEKVMTRLGLRFEDFERIGGAAVAPGLTKFLDTLQAFLQSHQSDVENFFATVEHGIEWLMTPRNLAWLREELDSAVTALQHFETLAEGLEHSYIFRKMFGLPAEGIGPDGGLLAPPGASSTEIPATPDNRSFLERFYKPGPGLLEQGLHWLLGNNVPGAHVGALRPELASASDAEADRQGVPRDFARTIFGIEHGLNADGTAAVSSAGAIGAGQLMPGTAHDMGVNDPTNLQQNVTGSIRYMHQLLEQFHGNQAAAAAAYNAGPNGRGVLHFAQTGDPSQLPLETQAYIKPILAHEQPPASPAGQPVASPAEQRFGSDANAPATPAAASDAPAPAYSTPQDGSGDPGARLAKLQVELRHVNPPAGAELNVVNADPSQIDVTGVKVMGAMPNSGQQRNIARDGY